ncbi:MAG TPA: DNA-3-methyladenine glycosylase [Asticcacaulis sp.]|nr:DNA-3-methyladenine glycosylase [Asticcacaulis sp.]
MTSTPLDSLHLAALAAADPKLVPLIDRFGAVVQYRKRDDGFESLLRLIIEQQLSVKAAETILGRLQAGVGEVNPQALLSHDEDAMRGYGLSRPKIAYVKALAEAVHSGAFNTDALRDLDTESAAATLVGLKGIGQWTAEVYLMFSEGRLDLFPVGDIALREAVGWLDGLPARPDEKYCTERAKTWSPYRSVAAHLMWAFYRAVKQGEMSRAL